MPSFKETYEAIKADWSKGEKNFNIECVMLSEGMQVKCTMGAKPFELIIDAPPGLDGTNEEVLLGKKLDIASLGIENVGAIADDGAITVISSGGTVTIEGVVFTGDAISSATTIAMAGALSGVTTATLTHTAPSITFDDSDGAGQEESFHSSEGHGLWDWEERHSEGL